MICKPTPVSKRVTVSHSTISARVSAVTTAGNFYLTWAPGQTTWQPHNRPAARRVQSMGWTPASELWLSVRGGDLFINDKSGPASEAFSQAKLGSRGFGILDVG